LALFLNTAHIDEAQYAEALGFIEGITTFETQSANLDTLTALVGVFDGHVFYQVTAPSLEARIDEAWQAYEVRPDRVVIAIPMNIENLGMISKLSGVDIALTGILSPAQAYLAAEAGAHYIIPNISTIAQSGTDVFVAMQEMTTIINRTETEILAMGIHAMSTALAVLRAGTHHLTLSLDLIRAMGNHEPK